jgi:hypothetical protein
MSEIPPPRWGADASEMRMLLYLGAATTLGAVSGLAAVLGSSNALSVRAVLAYLTAGGLVALGVVLVLGERYGFSYFLCGVAIFAGYKAFDVLAGISLGVVLLVRKVLGGQSSSSDQK